MAERMVQVPASLIEAHAAWLDDSGFFATAKRWRALLSQPEPSAEPDLVYRCEVCLEEFDADHYGDVEAHEAETGHDVSTFPVPALGPAEPPRIEDLAPGTTLDYPVRWEVGERGGMTGRVIVHMIGDGPARYLDEFNPSTIRDVTPPEGGDRG